MLVSYNVAVSVINHNWVIDRSSWYVKGEYRVSLGAEGLRGGPRSCGVATDGLDVLSARISVGIVVPGGGARRMGRSLGRPRKGRRRPCRPRGPSTDRP